MKLCLTRPEENTAMDNARMTMNTDSVSQRNRIAVRTNGPCTFPANQTTPFAHTCCACISRPQKVWLGSIMRTCAK
jgi:hypothetical protein